MRTIPTLHTDAAPPEYQSRGLIFLAGAIKYWWLYKCHECGTLYIEPKACHDQFTYPLFNSREHKEYVWWRNEARSALIKAEYLTYAPHEAFKGTWVEEAQPVNDAGIKASKAMLDLSPSGIPTEGTDKEKELALELGVPVFNAPPTLGIERLLTMLAVAGI